MLIHIGDKKIVRKKDIVALFDMDSATVSVSTRRYLTKAQEEKRVIPLGYELPKSFILMRDGTVYLSPFNTSTIK